MNNANLKSRLNGKLEGIQTKPTKGRIIAMNENNTTLAPVPTEYIALSNNALNIINENLKNQPLSLQLFDTVKSPTGGTTAFTVPSLSGDEIQKELIGIILDYTTPRAYWNTPDPIEGTPPTCYSRDSIISHEGKACVRCAFNDFGSKDGDSSAKACKESVALFLLRPDNIMPIIVRIPVTSKLIFQRYMTRLIGKMIPVCGVVTKITLEKTTSKLGQPYAQYNFEAVKQLSREETEIAKAFGKRFMDILTAADVSDIQETA